MSQASDRLQWWDNRFDKKCQRSPVFRHTHTSRWIESWSNPPWAKAGLSANTQGRAQQYGDGLNVDQYHGAPGREINRMARFRQMQLVAGTSFVTTPFEKEPMQGVNRNSSSTTWDVGALNVPGHLKEVSHVLNQDSDTYVCLLQESLKNKDLKLGKQVHARIIQSGFKPNIIILNTLVNMYAKCGSMVDARQVFDKMSERDVFTWTTIIAGYAQHGCGREALDIYEQMIQEGVAPNRVTFVCTLKACASLGALNKGKDIHANIIKVGIVPDFILGTALVDMYAKCGSMKDAYQVFDNLGQRNVVSWSAMITGYTQQGCGKEAFEMYEQMIQEGVMPNSVTFICVLKACASLESLEKGKDVHGDIIEAGMEPDIILETALVDMYAKCGSMKDACQVFDHMPQRNVVSWSAMIAGYAQHGCGREALEMYERMLWEGVIPNKVTFIGVLTACGSLGTLDKGKEVHDDIIKFGIASYINLENTLVDMYTKCGSIKDARQVFDKMSNRNVVSWNTMITGYSQHGCGREALEMYEQMIGEGVTPDKITFICVLDVCTSLAALEMGKEVHAGVIEAGIGSYLNLDNTLVNMYAKCGSMKDARQVFNSMTKRDVISWSAIIAGYAQHGCGREALQLFEQMQHEGLIADGITFMSLLSACTHAGLVDEGCHYFDSMHRDYGLTATMEHFGCMVDLFGRGGQLDEAEDFINKMPTEPSASVWKALLGACRLHANVELAEHAVKCLLKLDPQDAATYVLL